MKTLYILCNTRLKRLFLLLLVLQMCLEFSSLDYSNMLPYLEHAYKWAKEDEYWAFFPDLESSICLQEGTFSITTPKQTLQQAIACCWAG